MSETIRALRLAGTTGPICPLYALLRPDLSGLHPISRVSTGAPAMPDVSPQTDVEPAEVNRPPMKRPTPTIVSETIRALRLAGTTVRVPVLVRSLRDQTGCSRASAYRAIHDALAAGAIKCS